MITDITRSSANLPISALSAASYAQGLSAAANATSTGAVAMDQVQLSTEGRLLGTSGLLSNLILPTEENVRRLSQELSPTLRQFFSSNGISTQPPVEFSIASNGQLQINGNREDKDKILQLVKANPKLESQIRTVAAIASHAAAMQESLKFQKEYLASNNPEAVVAKYSYLFNSSQRTHTTGLRFDGNAVSITYDGKQWV